MNKYIALGMLNAFYADVFVVAAAGIVLSSLHEHIFCSNNNAICSFARSLLVLL